VVLERKQESIETHLQFNFVLLNNDARALLLQRNQCQKTSQCCPA